MSLSNDSIPAVAPSGAPQARDSSESFATGATPNGVVSEGTTSSLGTGMVVASDSVALIGGAGAGAGGAVETALQLVGGVGYAAFEKAVEKKFAKSGGGFNTREVFGLIVASIYVDGVWRPNGCYPSGRTKYIHRDTGTEYGPPLKKYERRLTYYGFDEFGYYRGEGAVRSSMFPFEFSFHDGRDAEGWNTLGFGITGIHKETGTLLGPDGATMGVYDPKTRIWYLRVDEDGYTWDGFDATGIHRDTGTELDPKGYDYKGVNSAGFHVNGIHMVTLSMIGPDGYDHRGFNDAGIHRETGRRFGPDGRDKYGNPEWDANGFNANGIHRDTDWYFGPDGRNKYGRTEAEEEDAWRYEEDDGWG